MDINDNIKNRVDLKSYFIKNAIPTESNFAEFIESVLNQREDGLVKLPGAPLSVEASGDASSQKKAINFYADFTQENPDWVLSLNPRSDPANPSTASPGFSISDADGNSRLFVSPTGNVGIGTTNPGANLDIAGSAFLGHETQITNFGDKLKSGFYQSHDSDISGDVPDTAHSWSHLITSRHSNINNNHQLQIAASYANNDKLYFRKIAATDTSNPDWKEIATRGVNTFTGNQKVTGGAITPAAGNSELAGIMFPKDPGGGGGDAAWIRYYPRSGEATTFEIGTSNDANDNISLMASGKVGIGTREPTHKFHVKSGNAIGLFESTGTQAYLRIASNEGMGNRVELANRPGGRLALWVAGGGDAFNITKDGKVGIKKTNPSAALDVNGFTESLGISVNNGANTGVGRGLWLWSPTDSNHVIYSANPSGKSPANKPAVRGYFDTGHRLRLRTAGGQGFLFENNSEQALVDIDSDNGNIWIKGSLTVADNFTAKIGCADFYIGHSGRRGSLGRALVDGTNVLHLNYGADWTKTKIHGVVSTPSSKKLKENIERLSLDEVYQTLADLSPVKFHMKSDPDKSLQLGFIAEEVPDVIATEDRDAIIPAHITAVLVGVVRDLEVRLKQLEAGC